VLSTALPWDAAPNDQVLADYAVAVRDLAAAKRAAGERVVLADPWSVFAHVAPTGAIVVTPGLLSPDHVHPTPAGYAALAAVYRDGVVAALALP
jgi:lysophospholipase L1-like esterase